MTTHIAQAVDPMSIILSSSAYRIWVELHHPNVPALTSITDLAKKLNVDEKAFAVARAKNLEAHCRAVISAMETAHK